MSNLNTNCNGAGSQSLQSDQVHIWKVNLNADKSVIQEYLGTLSETERDRSATFHFSKDSSRFIIRRGVLRILLSGYLKLPPEKIAIEAGEYLKPHLAIAGNDAELNFNLSFSKKMALIGFTLTRNIGVDIEYMEDKDSLKAISKRYFSRREIQELSRLPKEQFLEGFYNCWTRKEAFIKGVGLGLHFPLDKFVVSLNPGEPAQLLNVEGNPQEASRWSMFSIIPAKGFVAAAAIEGNDIELKYFEFQN